MVLYYAARVEATTTRCIVSSRPITSKIVIATEKDKIRTDEERGERNVVLIKILSLS